MLDTNVLLDWLLDRDPSRTKQIDALFLKTEGLNIPDVVIVELVFALEKVYLLSREIVVSNVKKVLDDPLFNCSRVLFHRAINEYLDHPAWSFVDSCLIHYADLQNVLPLWTFDKKIITQSNGMAKLPV